MERMSSESKLVVVTVAIVVAVVGTVMTMLYLGVRHQAMVNALANEQIDLDRNIELLGVMQREGIPLDTVRRVARAPWRDGTGVYLVTDTDSLPPTALGEELVTGVVHGPDGSFRVSEVFTRAQLLENVRTPLLMLIGIGVFALLTLGFAVRYVILRVSRPETRRRQRLDAELSVAERIQRGLVPSPGEDLPAEVSLAAMLRPAKEVAGDFYNFVTTGRRFHFIIADVSGKGVPAALFMAVTSKLYAAAAAADMPPPEIASRLNRELLRDNSEAMFATALIGRLDLDTGQLELCQAGHNPPVIFSAEEAPRLVRLPQNVPLGVVDGIEYAPVTLTLAGGSHLLLYTDGVTESADRHERLLGEEALLQALAPCGWASPATVVDTVTRAVDAHAGSAPQSDDITLLDIAYQATHRITLTPDSDGLRALYAFAAAHSMPDRLQLVAEEVVANIIAYSGATRATLAYTPWPWGYRLVVTDDGSPFDPTAPAPPAPAGAPAEAASPGGALAVGGKGILLMKSLASSVGYRRSGGLNILTITQSIPYEIHN